MVGTGDPMGSKLSTDDIAEYERGGRVRSLCKFFMPDTLGRLHTGEYADRLVRTERGGRITHRMIKERRYFDDDYQPWTLLEADF